MSREKETLHTIEETKTALKGKDTNVPSNNLIDRQAAISIPLTPKGLRKYQTCNLDDAYDEGWGDYQACISQLPLAQPEQRWIPVTERLPEDRDWYLGIFKELDTGWINPIPFICDYVGHKTSITTNDLWILKEHEDVEGFGFEYYKGLVCVAWMPLPKVHLGE